MREYMIRVYNSAYKSDDGFYSPREYTLDEVNIVTQKIDHHGRPYILFEHSDFPEGALRAEFDGEVWISDQDCGTYFASNFR